MNIPSPSDLNYFREVAIAGHLSRAAVNIGISQPSLTLAIQRLERNLGTILFVRSRKGVRLTNAGQVLFAQSKILLQSWDDTVDKIHKAHTEVKGPISIGCHPEVAIDSLPLFVPNLLEDYPRLDLRFIHMNLSRSISSAVISAEIDLGIVVNLVKHPDLITTKLSTDEFTLWVGPGKRKTQDLNGGNAVLIFDPSITQSQIVIGMLKAKKIKFDRILESSDHQVTTALVASGSGIGLLPSEVALRNPTLGLKRIKDAPVIPDEIFLIYRAENRKVYAIHQIATRITEGHRKKYGKF